MKNPILDASGMPKRHRNMKYADMLGDKWRRAFEIIKIKLGSGIGIVLCGPRGTGKTQLACMLLRYAAIELKTEVRYITAIEFFMLLKNSYRRDSDSSEMKIVADMSDHKILVVDALEEKSDSEWENRMLSLVVDKRYRNGLDTILVTNESPSGFEKSHGSSIIDRVCETGFILPCNWGSFRNKGK